LGTRSNYLSIQIKNFDGILVIRVDKLFDHIKEEGSGGGISMFVGFGVWFGFTVRQLDN